MAILLIQNPTPLAVVRASRASVLISWRLWSSCYVADSDRESSPKVPSATEVGLLYFQCRNRGWEVHFWRPLVATSPRRVTVGWPRNPSWPEARLCPLASFLAHRSCQRIGISGTYGSGAWCGGHRAWMAGPALVS